MQPRSPRHRLLTACLILLSPALAAAQTFSFAGRSFDQSNTPDSAFSLTSATYSGAVINSFATGAPSVTGFPSSGGGFDATKSLGRLLGLSTTSIRAVNLPNGNNGTAARSGFQLSWSGSRKLQNLSGDDLLIYESGSASNSPEGFMIQVFNLATASWSPWYYKPADAFELYVGGPSEGAFVTAIELDDLGVADGVAIDRIRLANLTDEDRMQDPSGTGVVLPEDNGSTSSYYPDPGPLAGYTMYSGTTLDPDPLYVAALHIPDSAACGNGSVEPVAGEQCDPGPDDPDDCCDASCHFLADATPCDDDQYCTLAGTCSSGACNVVARDCGDGNPCTQDSCSEGSDQCVNDPAPLDGTGCDDGQFCSVNDVCQSGSCSGTASSCNDNNACTADSCNEAGDTCVNDAAALNGQSCNDGDVCTASSTCSAGSCVAGPVTLVCGDGLTCGSEQCDDTNVAEGDGCSSSCQIELLQSRQQKSCIKLLNSAGSLVALTAGKVALGCLQNAQHGTVPDAQSCLENDPSGRLDKGRNKTTKAHDRACSVPPDFSESNVATINAAAIDESAALVADIFGGDLGAAAASSTTAAADAKCQKVVLKGYEKLAAAMRREFILCKSVGLDNDTIRSSASLEGCLDAITADGHGKVLAARTRLAGAIQDRCAGANLAVVFPGDCGAAPDLTTCISERVRCRTCRAFNGIDHLTRDCDLFDDGNADSSCPN